MLYNYPLIAGNLKPLLLGILSPLLTSASIFTYLSMPFSLFALLIASFALLNAIRRPKLESELYTYDCDEDKPALAIKKENRLVTDARPLS